MSADTRRRATPLCKHSPVAAVTKTVTRTFARRRVKAGSRTFAAFGADFDDRVPWLVADAEARSDCYGVYSSASAMGSLQEYWPQYLTLPPPT